MPYVVKRDFDSMSATWDEEPRRIKLSADIARAVKDNIPLSSWMKLLDYGCGTGLVSLHLLPEVSMITGLDSSQGMLDIFRKKIEIAQIKTVVLQQISNDSSATFTGMFDVILSTMTLHHVSAPSDLVSNLASHLNPGGYLCLADLDSEDGSFHDNPSGVVHFGFDRENVKHWMQSSNLVIINETTASVAEKEKPEGLTRRYPVFLVSGRKL